MPHDTGRRSAAPRRVASLLLVAATFLPTGAAAQAPTGPSADLPAWRSLHAALEDAQREHLWRVAAWGGLNLAAGLALVATAGADAPTRRGFGIQTAAWGAVNLAIAGWGFASGPGVPPVGLAGALAAEDGWAHLLLVNLGLNVGYVAVGSTLWIVSHRGLRSGDAVRGHGMAVVAQGLGLLVLDGLAWAASRHRLDALEELVEAVSVGSGPLPGAFTLGASLPWPG